MGYDDATPFDLVINGTPVTLPDIGPLTVLRGLLHHPPREGFMLDIESVDNAGDVTTLRISGPADVELVSEIPDDMPPYPSLTEAMDIDLIRDEARQTPPGNLWVTVNKYGEITTQIL